MITPLDIENKTFSKQIVNGYSTEEVHEFMSTLLKDYEKININRFRSRINNVCRL